MRGIAMFVLAVLAFPVIVGIIYATFLLMIGGI